MYIYIYTGRRQLPGRCRGARPGEEAPIMTYIILMMIIIIIIIISIIVIIIIVVNIVVHVKVLT